MICGAATARNLLNDLNIGHRVTFLIYIILLEVTVWNYQVWYNNYEYK